MNVSTTRKDNPKPKPQALDPIMSLSKVYKTYDTPSGAFTALKDVTLQVGKGEFVAIVGKSGSGKTTLINVITGIDDPTSGEVNVASAAVHSMNQEQLAVWRGKNVGVIFQFFQLLPTLTVAENIVLPMDFCKTYPVPERRKRAISLLEKVGIAEQADKLPADLSGGQQQRAAIARALANDPPILVADEPTGNLDSRTGSEILNLFRKLHAQGNTVIIVSHDQEIADQTQRVIFLRDGKIEWDRRNE